jgi:hypothetical protein
MDGRWAGRWQARACDVVQKWLEPAPRDPTVIPISTSMAPRSAVTALAGLRCRSSIELHRHG